MTDDDQKAIQKATRQVVRGAATGGLATVMRETEGAPYASLVSVATDHDGSPILLLSDLADHTRNLKDDDRVSLLLAGESGQEDPLAGERVTLQGRLQRGQDPAWRQRFLRKHPSAALYVDFGDFGFYRLTIQRAHLVAGFGRIHWLDGSAIMIQPSEELIQAEAGIVAHMNDDHADALQLYATKLLGQADGAWQMTGVDGDGIDLRLGATTARLPFEERIENSTDVRKALINLVNKARSA